MQEIMLIAVYFAGLFILCAIIRYRDVDDAFYFLAAVWPLMTISVPFFAVVWAGVKIGDAIKRWRHDC